VGGLLCAPVANGSNYLARASGIATDIQDHRLTSLSTVTRDDVKLAIILLIVVRLLFGSLTGLHHLPILLHVIVLLSGLLRSHGRGSPAFFCLPVEHQTDAAIGAVRDGFARQLEFSGPTTVALVEISPLGGAAQVMAV
jgi:hypothetical protein